MQRRGLSDVGYGWRDVFQRAGLVDFPRREGSGPFYVPFRNNTRPSAPMGFAAFRNQSQVPVFTISCASCHTRNLFGRPVLGGTNLLGGTGDTLLLLKKVAGLNDRQFRFATRPSVGETAAFHAMQYQLSFVHGKKAQAAGLENPVAFVGLSLAGRAADAHATRTCAAQGNVDRSPLWRIPTDTKAPVLWNLKYKDRFQHDGSMTGNPMLANLIFNEIGRGADLRQLQRWIDGNGPVIRDMTAAARDIEAPRWTDFFPADSIDLEKAKRGERVFRQRCARCHGTYEKAWNSPADSPAGAARLLKTVLVTMPKRTAIRNVGTDPHRSNAMTILAPMANRLAIFQKNGITLEAHPGAYAAPPLVGIWARWPYMHNNSIPNLDELLKPAARRVKWFYVGPADDPRRDFDQQAVGFPLGRKSPRSWWRADRRLDTSRPGLSNAGHDEGIFATGGVSDFLPGEKRDLLEFLKTL